MSRTSQSSADKKDKKEAKDRNASPKHRKPLQLIIFILFGVVLILLSILEKNRNRGESNIISDLLNSVGQALIIGPAISWILDLPSMIKYFKRITIESLISSEYLNSLERDRLMQLRKDCTANIHLKDAPNVESGLINMDENVCELLTQPYYDRYRQNTTCTKDGQYFRKKHHTEELIINPLPSKVKYDDFPNTYLGMLDGEELEDVYKVVKITVKVDDNDEQDITSKIIIAKKKIYETDIHFDTVVTWLDQENKDLSIEFTKSLLINRIVEIRTAVTDVTFFKRVKMPVKSFKIDYHYAGNDLKLVGSCFGTLSYPNSGGIRVIQELNYISIESFVWMLPGNGIFIVKVPTSEVGQLAI